MDYKVNIIIEKDEDGYYAYYPKLPGCQSQGHSLEEVSSGASHFCRNTDS